MPDIHQRQNSPAGEGPSHLGSKIMRAPAPPLVSTGPRFLDIVAFGFWHLPKDVLTLNEILPVLSCNVHRSKQKALTIARFLIALVPTSLWKSDLLHLWPKATSHLDKHHLILTLIPGPSFPSCWIIQESWNGFRKGRHLWAVVRFFCWGPWFVLLIRDGSHCKLCPNVAAQTSYPQITTRPCVTPI